MRSYHSLRFRPFEGLDDIRLFPDTDKPSKPKTPTAIDREKSESPHCGDIELFRRAMAGVEPLKEKIEREEAGKKQGLLNSINRHGDEQDVVDSLRDLVGKGSGFAVEQTPEYMAGTLYHEQGNVIERLHGGEFAVQAYIDLHGLTRLKAAEALESFFARSIERGIRMILIIHGRGKSSPVKPVLKTMVREWLTKGPFRAWIIAYSSARLCDGGAGATYVLLRHRRLTKSGKRRRGSIKKEVTLWK